MLVKSSGLTDGSLLASPAWWSQPMLTWGFGENQFCIRKLLIFHISFYFPTIAFCFSVLFSWCNTSWLILGEPQKRFHDCCLRTGRSKWEFVQFLWVPTLPSSLVLPISFSFPPVFSAGLYSWAHGLSQYVLLLEMGMNGCTWPWPGMSPLKHRALLSLQVSRCWFIVPAVFRY